MKKVKVDRPRGSRISSKHQITIPAQALREAGLSVGERVVARVEGPGRVVLERADDILEEYAGALSGVFKADELERLRDEWD